LHLSASLAASSDSRFKRFSPKLAPLSGALTGMKKPLVSVIDTDKDDNQTTKNGIADNDTKCQVLTSSGRAHVAPINGR
jgi:hypothetical protein